jgi:hypothetical protein
MDSIRIHDKYCHIKEDEKIWSEEVSCGIGVMEGNVEVAETADCR